MKLPPNCLTKYSYKLMLASSLALFCANVAAQVIQKPGIPYKGSEFGTVLDRYEQYTLVGADSEGDKDLNEALGVVRLFQDSNTTPIRTYQFSPDSSYPRDLGNKMDLGITVSMSNSWLAMGIGRWAYSLSPPYYKAGMVLVRKNSGNFPACPTNSQGVIDCRGFLQPIFFDGDSVLNGYQAQRGKFNISVSEKHLVAGFTEARNRSTASTDDDYGYAKLMTYNSSTGAWESKATVGNLPLSVGASVAVDDAKAAIAAPVRKGTYEDSVSTSNRTLGRVVTMRWDNTAKTWSRKDLLNTQDLPYFANALAMSGDTLVVASGFPGPRSATVSSYAPGYLSFYRYINNEWVLEETLATERAAVRVAVHQNMAIISLPGNNLSGTDSPVQAFQGIEDTSQGGLLRDWQSFGGVRRQALLPWTDGTAWGPDGLDLSRERIAFGWRAAPKFTPDGTKMVNVGLVALEDFGALYESSSEFSPPAVSTTTTPRVISDHFARLGGINTAFSEYYGNYNGSGYIALLNGLAEWSVSVPTSGTYKICMRYANGLSGTALAGALFVNGSASGSIPAPPTGGWATWNNACVSKYLVAGVSRIRIQQGSSAAPNIDSISIGK